MRRVAMVILTFLPRAPSLSSPLFFPCPFKQSHNINDFTALTGRRGGRLRERVNHRLDHRGTLSRRGNRRTPVAGLKAVPAKLRVIAPLEPHPTRRRRQL